MNNLLKIGDINITGLSDGPNVIDPTILFPETPLEAWEPYYDIFPEFFHGKHFKVNLGTFVISNNDSSIVVDTGLGPHGDMFGTSVPGQLIQDFKNNNISFDSIDKVFLTHLHGDHYGWNYREDLDDRPPTFPNAKYMVNRLDWDHWLSEKMLSDDPDDSLRRSVLPLLDDGLLDLMEGDTNLTKGVQAIHTPGHTNGCVSYYIDGFIFTGDTLFIEGTGRTDFQGGSAENTYDSVRNKIFNYPEETIVYPGHNYKGLTQSTIKYERKCNPNVGDSINREDFVNREKNMERPYPKRFKIAVPANMYCGKKQK